ncbi:hypothetical protein, partial [Acutalibacter muris]|uniref:hypothetical protein n=1 Tax=Acutalibacter muris TaxID=1796620 RepID=UPI00272E3EDC
MTTRIDVGAVLLERARTIIKMKKAGLDLRWLHEFDTASLAACCECIVGNQLEPITKEENIQREL